MALHGRPYTSLSTALLVVLVLVLVLVLVAPTFGEEMDAIEREPNNIIGMSSDVD